MKEKIVYVCEICSQRHDSKSEAEKCEKKHAVFTKVGDFFYDEDDDGVFPTEVVLYFGNMSRLYVRDGD